MIEPGQSFAVRYQMQRLLGRGAFSEVWLANDTKAEGVEVAIKIYAPSTGLDDKGLQMFAHEFTTVMNINHRNLLKPIYFDDYERQPYLVLPYCRRGSLESAVGEMGEREAWTMIRDVAAGLAELHSKQPPVVHQDIKPANIMQDDEGRYLITDFGVSTKLRSTLRRSQGGKADEYNSAGTMAYMAPERFGRMNKPVMSNDIYSLGATMFEMLTGDVPFGNLGGVAQANGAVVPYVDCDCSDQLKQVVERCLAKDPWDRPVAAQLEEWAKTGLRGGVIDFSRKWEGDEPVAPPSGGTSGGGRPTEWKPAEGGGPSVTASGTLSVSSNPSGAEVYVDGTLMGTTPASVPGLSVGTHQVEVRRQGYASGTLTTTVSPGQESAVSFTLQAVGPASTVTQPTIGMSLGKKLGIAAAIVVFAALGAVVALLTPPKHPDRGDDNGSVIAEVVTDTTAVPSADLPSAHTQLPLEDEPPAQRPAPAEEEDTAQVVTAPTELSLSCETSGATLYVDGVRKGTGSWSGEVSPGSHRLEARKDGYTTATHTLTVREGRTVEYTFPALTVSTGSLRVTSDPSGADVYIDGTRVGTTPGSFSGLTAGPHQVEVRKTGYTSATRTATVNSGQEVTVTLTLQSTSRGTINGHEYVDLGLSVKWATCNVGASSPSNYGNYYAWGETTTKSSYEPDNSKTYNNSSYNRDISGDPSLDAARANWGSTWRMPNKTEFQELLSQCSWQWTSQGGHYGYKVTSTKNGNSIFLPAAGNRGGSSLGGANEVGYYWSSSPYEGSSDSAFHLYFNSSNKDLFSFTYRCWGFPVRPVSE